jgi:hypothetical protein
VKRAQVNDYLIETARAARNGGGRLGLPESVRAARDPHRLTPMLRPKYSRPCSIHSARHPLEQLRGIVAQIKKNDRRKIFEEHFGKQRHRRDKPGRASKTLIYVRHYRQRAPIATSTATEF